MSYESAPATKILATSCACCGRPLVDATSVETGVGPDCRARFGYAEAQGEPDWTAAQHALNSMAGPIFPLPLEWNLDARRCANVIVYHIALEQSGPNVNLLQRALVALGYTMLAERIAKRLAKIQIEVNGQEYLVKAPYIEDAPSWASNVPGARWSPTLKRRIVPVSSRKELFAALQRAYPGQTAVGPKGLFTL